MSTCKSEIVRFPDCDCEWCSFPSKSSMKFQGLIAHPKMTSNERYKDHCDLVPVGQCSKETEVNSLLGNKMSNYIANPNTKKLATRALISVFTCTTCGCPRGLFCAKKHFPPEFFKWLLKECLPDYDYTRRDFLFPDNNIKTVKLPDERWCSSECTIEFRRILTCKSSLELKTDSFVEKDGNVTPRCCYCGSEEIDIGLQLKGTRSVCNTCVKKKSRIRAGAKKSDKKELCRS